MKRIKSCFTVMVAALVLTVPVLTGAQDQGAPEAKGDKHTVVKGDTLWDISGAYLKDPFLWPEVWKVNPGIKNPDLIYPGERVVLPGMAGKAEAAAKEEAAEEGLKVPGKKAVAPVGGVKAKKGDSPFEEAPIVDISKTLLLVPEEKEDRVVSLDTSTKEKVPVATQGAIMEAGFIAAGLDDPMRIAGATIGSRDIYSLDNVLLITPKPDIRPGDLLLSVGLIENVEHPATGEEIGALVKPTGLLRMEGTKDGYMLARVIRTINDIRPGNLLVPYTAPELVYDPVPKNPKLKGEWGYIVVAQDQRNVSALMYTVYLDLGSDDAVKPGDSFTIRRSGGPAQTGEGVLPDIEVGELQVISVQEATSTAKVVNFTESLRPGYRVYYKD